MHLSNQVSLIPSTIYVILSALALLFIGNTTGQSRLHRMPEFFGKRSGDSGPAPHPRQDRLRRPPTTSDAFIETGHFIDGFGKNSPLMRLLSKYEGGVYSSNIDETPFQTSLKDDNDGTFVSTFFKDEKKLQRFSNDEYENIIDGFKQMDKIDSLLKESLDHIRKLQDEMMAIIMQESTGLTAESRDSSINDGHSRSFFKRGGTLARLPQFYGKKK